MDKEIGKAIYERGSRILKTYGNVLKQFKMRRFYIAGNSLNNLSAHRGPTDIDIFPTDERTYQDVRNIQWSNTDIVVLAHTKNAVTLRAMDKTFQVCSYIYPDINQLIDSFDFSHIQIGVEVRMNKEFDFMYIDNVAFTEAWRTSQALHNSRYIGSQYPLSSLLRASKYYKYGEISRGNLIGSVFAIIRDIYRRGFIGFEDFKDQLDAVDLGLLPEDFKDLQYNDLIDLFELLNTE